MDIFDTYAVDEDKELNGAWVPLGDAKLLVARMGNRAYTTMIGAEVDRNEMVLNKRDTDEDTRKAEQLDAEIMGKVLTSTILLGWEGVTYKGKPLDYSKENAQAMLAHRDFRIKVIQLSNDVTVFKAKREAEEEKN